MSDSMTEWIAAYYDGELSSERRAWVEDHLAVCADCRRELDDLRSLSVLLQDSPVPASRLSDEKFTRQVLRRLPPPQIPFWSRAFQGGVRYAPIGLFGIYAFFQSVIAVSGVVLLLMGLFPSVGNILPSFPASGAPVETNLLAWLNRAGTFVTLPIFTSVIRWLDGLGIIILLELVVGLVFAALFLAWLATYWSQRRHQAVEISV